MRLENKICLITGSSRGIGKKIAEAFSNEGAYVIITYNKNKKEAIKLSKKIKHSSVYKLNVSKKNQIKKVFSKVKKNLKELMF